MKIVFLDAATLGDVSLAPISRLGEFECYQTSSREEALERVKDAEVLIINKVQVDKELMHQRKIHVDLGKRRETGKVSFQRFLANIRFIEEHTFVPRPITFSMNEA